MIAKEIPKQKAGEQFSRGYHNGSDPLHYSDKNMALKESTSKIYGLKGTTTALASAINHKDLLKLPCIRLNDESKACAFISTLYSHSQCNGIYVPSMMEVERDNPMGKAWNSMIATHAHRDAMSTMLYNLLNKLCQDDKIATEFHQVIPDSNSDSKAIH